MPVTTQNQSQNPTCGGASKGQGGSQVGTHEARANKKKRPNHIRNTTTWANLGKYSATALDDIKEGHNEENDESDNDDDGRNRDFEVPNEELHRISDTDSEEEDDNNTVRPTPSDKESPRRKRRFTIDPAPIQPCQHTHTKSSPLKTIPQ